MSPPTPPPYLLVPPSEPATRFVFASPHSGDLYPAEMGFSAATPALRSAEDALVDRLIACGPGHGATLIMGRFGRACLDLNRDPDELDPDLIDDCPAATPTAKVAAGFGVIPRLSGDGLPLYDRRLSLDEAKGRIAALHAPYHAALTEVMQATRTRHGKAVLIDWHSMPARAGGGARGADVVLGDRHGTACSTVLTRSLRARFEALGWTVALNQPYAGGYSTQVWGRPSEGFEAVQIELSRRLYLDEATLTPNAGWSRCLKGVERVIAGVTADAA